MKSYMLVMAVLFVGCGNQKLGEVPLTSAILSVAKTEELLETDDRTDTDVPVIEVTFPDENSQLIIPKVPTLERVKDGDRKEKTSHPEDYRHEIPAPFNTLKDGDVAVIHLDGVASGVGILPTPMKATISVVVGGGFSMPGIWECEDGRNNARLSTGVNSCTIYMDGIGQPFRGFSTWMWTGKIVAEGDHFRMIDPQDNLLDAEEIKISEVPELLTLRSDFHMNGMGLILQKRRQDKDGNLLLVGDYRWDKKKGAVVGILYPEGNMALVLIEKNGTQRQVEFVETNLYRKNGNYIISGWSSHGMHSEVFNQGFKELMSELTE